MKGVGPIRFLVLAWCLLQSPRCFPAQEPIRALGSATVASVEELRGEASKEDVTTETVSAVDETVTVLVKESLVDETVEEDHAAPYPASEAVAIEGVTEPSKDIAQKCACDCNVGITIRPSDSVEIDTTLPIVMEQDEEHNSGDDEPVTTQTLTNDSDVVETTDTVVKSCQDITASPTPMATLPISSKEVNIPCTSAGDFAHDQDCRQYFSCVHSGSVDSTDYTRVDRRCAPGTAFSIELARCARDLSGCNEGFSCLEVGSFPDPTSNASYYWCPARLTGGLHKYHVKCAIGEIFMPQLGKCFIDINNLQNLPLDYYAIHKQPDDEDIIKAELKEFKVREKIRLKQQKLKERLEQKLQKELEKKLRKEAKLKDSSSEEDTFNCIQEGKFPASSSANRYYSCITKKGKLKAIYMMCPMGQNFDQSTSSCV